MVPDVDREGVHVPMTILSKPGDPLLVVCAWCDFDKDDPRNAHASHGICKSCLDRWLPAEPVKAQTEAA